jgi:hypothetical protein
MRTRAVAVVLMGTLVMGACADGDGTVLGQMTDPDETTVTTVDLPPTQPPDPPDPPDPDGPGGGGDDTCGDPPVWVLKATDDPDGFSDDEPRDEEPPDDGCDVPDGPELGTGDVQITLRWSSDADLDLHVFEPDGTEIYFGDPGPTRTGGRLDVDSNIGCENDGSVENVFWPEGDLPLGEYRIEIHGYTVDGCGGGDYTVTAKVEGEQILEESGSVAEDEDDPYTFEVN